MNITKDFTTYMSSLGFGTFGVDLFIGGVPLNAPSTCWWVISAGGASEPRNATGERQNRYVISVFYRNIDTEAVYNQLQSLSDGINSSQCIEFDNYTVVDAEATVFPTDQDLDNEDRTIGIVQITIAVYQN